MRKNNIDYLKNKIKKEENKFKKFIYRWLFENNENPINRKKELVKLVKFFKEKDKIDYYLFSELKIFNKKKDIFETFHNEIIEIINDDLYSRLEFKKNIKLVIDYPIDYSLIIEAINIILEDFFN
ncbi:MAG: hypothetical protein N2114_05280 [Candidatus Goldbacteria bacterium]|nr:hypothetical protein [Candidatus Goldiibacteriota bacterium]